MAACGFPITVNGALMPCGKCQGCLRRWRRAWVGRMLTEAAALGESSFITLTYADDPLRYHPETETWTPSLEKSHIKNWQRSVRRKATPLGLPKRFFIAGEYGSQNGHPHYHVILFGIGPTWKPHFVDSWEHGFQSWYAASAKSMAYVAKYCLKHARDPELEKLRAMEWGDVELTRVSQEPFRMMSRNPPIGAALASKVAATLGKPGLPQELLQAEKALKGEFTVGKDKYPIARTIRERLDRELGDVYDLPEGLRDRMLGVKKYEPTQIEIENAKTQHTIAKGRLRSNARRKL